MLSWFAPRGRPVHVLLTKSDKLGRAEQGRTLAAVRRDLAAWDPTYDASLFSSLKKTGMPEIETVLARWLGFELSADKKLAAENVGSPPPSRPLE
jgi:GTP-binding protein